ncbi:MAG: hypothetical protein H7Z40_03930 [Phycisphaerae bacterium]|nr:hypothetical protein [Gemmatimonadaceae bacterium]
MQHLESERIAAFDHDAPTPGELAHLEACATCRAERVAFSTLSKRALQLIDAPVAPPMPRLTDWESLSARLRTERLMESAPETLQAGHSSRVRNEWWRMAAAAVMLVAGGAVWGRFSETASSIGPRSSDLAPITSDVLGLGIGSTGFSSMEEATKALAKIERDFNRTSLWMTANDPSANASDVLRRRLAQLDQLVAVAYDATTAAPQDKVLAHYHRSAQAARELTIQQLGNALPPGRSLERF